jgi:hypothetical protein
MLVGRVVGRALSPPRPLLEQLYDALTSSLVFVSPDREATADGLNPLTISHTARVSSCRPTGMFINMVHDPEKGSV